MRKNGRMRIGMWTPSVGNLSATSVVVTGASRANVLQKEKEKAKAKQQMEKERQREKERTKDKARALVIWCVGRAISLDIGLLIAPRTRELAMLRRESPQTMLALRRWSFRLEASFG